LVVLPLTLAAQDHREAKLQQAADQAGLSGDERAALEVCYGQMLNKTLAGDTNSFWFRTGVPLSVCACHSKAMARHLDPPRYDENTFAIEILSTSDHSKRDKIISRMKNAEQLSRTYAMAQSLSQCIRDYRKFPVREAPPMTRADIQRAPREARRELEQRLERQEKDRARQSQKNGQGL
jgi:hypothetical protein